MFRIVSRTRRTAVKLFAAIGPVATALLLFGELDAANQVVQ
jgi:hypothetical protein